MRLSPTSRIIATALFIVAAFPAPAATTCVANVAQLRSALAAAENQTSFDIRLRSGLYALTAGSGTHALVLQSRFLGPGPFRISGGWDIGCAQQRSGAGLETFLDGQDLTGILRIYMERYVTQAIPNELRVDHLRFRRGRGPQGSGGALIFSYTGNTQFGIPNTQVLVDSNSFEFNTDALAINAHAGANVRNNWFYGNEGLFGAALSLTTDNGGAVVNNNTFRANLTSGDRLAPVLVFGPEYKYLGNNVFAESIASGNVQVFDVVADARTTLRRNRLESFGPYLGQWPLVLESTAVAPRFENTVSTRPAVDSPLRDAGSSAVVGQFGSQDYDGRIRVQGAAIDLGAFELPPLPPTDLIHADGFEN